MRKISLFLAAALVFGVGPIADRLGPVPGSAVLVALGVVLALAASGFLNSVAIAAGAAGAFASGMLSPLSAAAGGAVMLGLCYAERTVRVRSAGARAAHLAVALAGGAIAGLVAQGYATADLAVRLVVASVLAALPLIIEADDPLAHGLETLASELPEPTAGALREGAELRRTVDASLLDRATRRHAARSWRQLLRLAQARARLHAAVPAPLPAPATTEGSKPKGGAHREAVIRQLDRRISEHVATLARAFAAADEVRAAELSLDDGALRNVETTGESLEQVSRAFVEDVGA